MNGKVINSGRVPYGIAGGKAMACRGQTPAVKHRIVSGQAGTGRGCAGKMRRMTGCSAAV